MTRYLAAFLFVYPICCMLQTYSMESTPFTTAKVSMKSIQSQCSWLLNSLPHLGGKRASTFDSYCKFRFEQLISQINQRYNSSHQLNESRNIGIIDLDHTLCATIKASALQKQDLHARILELNHRSNDDVSYFMANLGIHVLRNGTMNLIDTFYSDPSADLVLYSMGGLSHVIINAIFMEIVYNYYWDLDETSEPTNFRFTGIIATPYRVQKSFGVVIEHGYDLRKYKHIVVIDDQHANVWIQSDPIERQLIDVYGITILKLSNGAPFGLVTSAMLSMYPVPNLFAAVDAEKHGDKWLFSIAYQQLIEALFDGMNGTFWGWDGWKDLPLDLLLTT
eukprot:23531_1